jgi:hypothetical protein
MEGKLILVLLCVFICFPVGTNVLNSEYDLSHNRG